MNSVIRVRVPATTSNLGPGFDVLGLALTLHNDLELRCEKNALAPRLSVEILGEGAQTLPQGENNLVVRSLRQVLPRKEFSYALRLRMINRIPLSRGLGSSAAARLCGLLAGWALSRKKRAIEKILSMACRAEGHPDNVTPAYYGGLCASFWDGRELRHFRIKESSSFKKTKFVICVPDFEVSTKRARAILPKKIPFLDAVTTSSKLALLLGALERGRLDWLKTAMQDVLHQPYRKALVPGLNEVIAAALKAGAFGSALSGSGSAILALAPRESAPSIGRAMQAAFLKLKIISKVLLLDIERKGARVQIS